MAVEVAEDGVPANVKAKAESADKAAGELKARFKAQRDGVPAPEAIPPAPPPAPASVADAPPAEPVVAAPAESPTPMDATPVAPPVAPVMPQAPQAPTAPPIVSPASVPVTVVPATPEAAVLTLEELQRENSVLRHQLSTFHGRHGSELGRANTDNEALREELSKLRALQLGTPPAPEVAPVAPALAPTPTPALDMAGLTKYVSPEAVKTYGDELVTLAGQVARAVTESYQIDPSAQMADMDALVDKKIQAAETRMSDEQYWREVERLAPGARTVNGDVQADIPPHPDWPVYVATPISSGSSLTIRDELTKAAQTDDAPAFATHIKAFQALHPDVYGTSNVLTPPTVQEQVVPPAVPASTPPAPDPAKRMIPESEIAKHRQAAAHGGLTPEEADKKTAEYNLAYREGRVQKGV